MVMATATEVETEPIPSVKDLASSEPQLRRNNLQAVTSHLESRSSSNHITHTQALQLWRGFSVSLYMHDSKNQLSVQTLIATLSSTFQIVRAKDVELKPPVPEKDIKKSGSLNGTNSNHEADIEQDGQDDFLGFEDEPVSNLEIVPDDSWLSNYTSAFWETISREWTGIDQWRMNKYLLLIRFALREILTISLSAYFGVKSFEIISRTEETTSPTDAEETKQSQPTLPLPASKSQSSRKRKTPTTNTDTTTQDSAASTKKPKKNNTQNPQSPISTTPASKSQPSTVTPTDPHVLTAQLSILANSPFSPRDRKTPDGLRLHMLDIYVDEVFRAIDAVRTLRSGAEGPAISMTTTLSQELMGPVRGVAENGLARHVRKRAREVLEEFGERLSTET